LPSRFFVLVGGWPGSGKSTLAVALGAELGVPVIAKDVIKGRLMTASPPESVEQSRELGRLAVHEMLRLAGRERSAVLDSTWYPYTRSAVLELPGELIEVRCLVPLEVARQRYAARVRGDGHFDRLRTEAELWGEPVAPLGVGPLVEVDTTGQVDVAAVAAAICGAVPGPLFTRPTHERK